MAIQSHVIGNLAADCEQIQLGQTPALKFRVGSTRSRKDRDGQRVTDWVLVVIFRTQLAPYLLKGTKVMVSGELEARPWINQQGQADAGLQMVANAIEFLSAKPENHNQQPAQYQAQPPAQPQYQTPPQQPQYYAPPQPQSPVPPTSQGDPHLPF